MQLAESEPRVDVSMGRNIIEIPKENKGFQRRRFIGLDRIE